MSHVNTGRWLIDRRTALRGLGATLALPLLECMVPRRARGAGAELPKRSVFVYIPNGVNTLTWQIETAGAGYAMPVSQSSLEKHRGEITPISGLHHPNAMGSAHQCEKSWLTGAALREVNGALRNTVSVDQRMAEFAGKFTRHPSLELAITGETLAWSNEGVPLPSDRKPGVVFDRIFGVKSGGAEEARRDLRRRRSVLDFVLEDARRMRREIGGEDRTRLDDYLAAVRDVEQRCARADAWLDIPTPAVDDATRDHLSRSIPDSAAGDYYRTIYDLIALALRTDMTRVVTCMIGSESFGFALPEIGIKQTRHELSHHSGKPETMARLTRCDTFLAQGFSYFLDQLKTLSEEGESLLDRTMVLYGSGMSYGHNHGNANLPLILAGGASLGIRHGRHIDYNLPKIGAYDLTDVKSHYSLCLRPADDKALFSNLLLTMLRRMDVAAESFSDSQCQISELLADR